MAEINIPAAGGKKTGVRRSKKHSTRVDLTPMVDLGFLLITFFIFTTSMSSPRAMNLAMPKDTPPDKQNQVPESNALTVIPLNGDKIFYYHGDLNDALKANTYGVTNYSVTEGIGQIVRTKQVILNRKKPGNRDELVVMIKPTPESNYENLVSVLDEMLINDVKRYAVMDLTPEEKEIALAKSELQ
ncbi:biopolymer transporter ExbD [Niastella caeni]|uniref:Biopolymer transporter ExbD n=1 Tax=Niastella caeni TaxID=2569763 RepID=A0A4S8I4V3_9BACT|nr:biopolymer transporter ExbD [Niastella caeni]THU41842.1 biopolymer transporter ExbD [Niastella caeni]